MKVNYVHDFNQKTEEEFLNIQNNLKERINVTNKIDLENIKVCAGIDIAYWEKNNETIGACSIVIIDFQTKKVLEKVQSVGKIEVPYIAGFLAFRELPLILEAVEKITVEPDIFIFDGNGYLHHNNMGIAAHAGLFLNRPTIGVGKTYFKIDKVDFIMPENEVGSYTDIVVKNKVYGRAVRTSKSVKPIFISCGNNIDLNSCYEIVMNLLSQDSRIPIPTRLADLETHVLRQEYR
ncbi:endonuclease V [Clostridium tagluense]|uniref:endonuclease V n=1 Tax=Clostridium tagluense TaxID=360422 RepID=UPI001CF3B24D|nr:endonuclease V [Clostridium tagluense]MCB2313373.1 endonuclease V [Clostridium tagluense]MCB2318197.1 endonuclease V [Clostridium tagluense]MCB2322977.1 endonuclease V [Clostridium tagluense]MCB2327981.1 endonuclease V [Clostridium tagluense]MCB2332679.1 endonuclease V [Clostridium tagluense]